MSAVFLEQRFCLFIYVFFEKHELLFVATATYRDRDSVACVSNNFSFACAVCLRYQYGQQDGGALFSASNVLKIITLKRSRFRNKACDSL